MSNLIRTTYRQQNHGGMTTRAFDYYTKERVGEDIKLVGWGTYGSASVLSGQASKNALGWFDSEVALNKALAESGINPNEVEWSSKWTEPSISVNHLPDEGDW